MKTRIFLTAFGLTLIGAGLHFAPKNVAAGLRGAIQDMMRPGWQVARFAKDSLGGQLPILSVSSPARADQSLEDLADQLAAEQERSRALQTRLAQLTERYVSDDEITRASAKSDRLLLPSLVEVAILGDTLSEQWRAGKFLDQGAKNGLRENELVVSTRKSQRTLIDFGEDASISTEDALLLGRYVIGKVENVGKWTSTVLLVTDSHYRGRAQLIRKTDDGQFVFGEARGILKGQGGPLCKLEGIPAESSVHIHDAVYTAERDGILPTPLYYGEVVEATLGQHDREWTVLVRPVPLPTSLTKVQVLRTTFNPDRMAVTE